MTEYPKSKSTGGFNHPDGSPCSKKANSLLPKVRNKLNIDPYNTRGEEIKTKFEDDYKFHRYTNRYGNAFGSEFYTIRITCR